MSRILTGTDKHFPEWKIDSRVPRKIKVWRYILLFAYSVTILGFTINQ